VVLSLIGPDAQPLDITAADNEELELMMETMATSKQRRRSGGAPAAAAAVVTAPAAAAAVGVEMTDIDGNTGKVVIFTTISTLTTKVHYWHYCTGGITLGTRTYHSCTSVCKPPLYPLHLHLPTLTTNTHDPKNKPSKDISKKQQAQAACKTTIHRVT